MGFSSLLSGSHVNQHLKNLFRGETPFGARVKKIDRKFRSSPLLLTLAQGAAGKETFPIQCVASLILEFLCTQKCNDVTTEVPGTFLQQMGSEGGLGRSSVWTGLQPGDVGMRG